MNLTPQDALDALVGLAVIGWICYRQTTWRVVDPARMWRGPLIFGVIGLARIVTAGTAVTLDARDVAMLAAELVLGLGVGATMGAIARFRPLAPEAIAVYEAGRRGGRGASGPVEYESRTGWFGLVLWLVLIAVRIGLDAAAQRLGAHALAATGVVLLVLAANRAARTATLTYRLDQHRQAVRALSV